MRPDRDCLIADRCFFCSRRLRTEARVGLVGRRGRSVLRAERISVSRRANAAFRLASCERNSSQWRTIVSSCEIRFSRRCRSRAVSSGESPESPESGRAATTFVLTLFTFCPPGPPERAKVYVVCCSMDATSSLRFMVPLFLQRARLPVLQQIQAMLLRNPAKR